MSIVVIEVIAQPFQETPICRHVERHAVGFHGPKERLFLPLVSAKL
jgi:hypothetical protein